ncbi:MAG: 50S ribosomal protein L32 [Candidatus Caenarcaniphilales bacterium]|nr:50S ribosomal protein L32 [Candidatus Caenarcaniphilales bacterium]
MAVPKKRKSKQRSRQVVAGRSKLNILKPHACTNCGTPVLSHRACGSCGYYNGRIIKLKNEAAETA